MAIRLVTTVLLLLLLRPLLAAELPEFVVVAHPDVPVDAISERELRRIYLGKSRRWSGGLTIRPVMLDRGEMLARFVDEALGRTEENFSVYWKRMIFTGKGRPPRTFGTAEELAFYVSMTPGAIGYLPADAARPGVKVIRVD
jgi:ABC-type phosphate transport system substrate-binding protein